MPSPGSYGARLTMVALLISVSVQRVTSCHSESTDIHVCLHTFLERDFTQIQAYLDNAAQEFIRRRQKLLLEGPTLDNICSILAGLGDCYEEVGSDCTRFFFMVDFDRLMRGYRAWQQLLCSGNKEGIREFLQHGACVERFRKRVVECHMSELEWPLVWAQIFRLQKTNRICGQLYEQTECILNWLPRSECGADATDMYNRTMNTWLDAWCTNGAQKMVSNSTWLFLLIVLLWTGLATRDQ